MYHYVAHSVPGTLLFHDLVEMRDCWRQIVAAMPGPHSAALMPNHLHLLHRELRREAFLHALGSFAQERNARRGNSGPVFERPIPDAVHRATRDKQQRDEKYIVLNPTRARLCKDPLAWAFSTHRDAVGFSLDPVRRRVADPHEHHRRISTDESVSVQGTPFPSALLREPTLDDIADAVSALTRTFLGELRRRGRARTLFLRAARQLTSASSREIADWARVDARTIRRVVPRLDPSVAMIARVAGDPRFPGLLESLPTARPQWTVAPRVPIAWDD
jgi:hypothetical protein